MESDDDYQSFSPPQEFSPPVQTRKLKRLKKAISVSHDPIVDSPEKDLAVPFGDSSNSETLKSFEVQELEDSNEPPRSLDEEKESSCGVESLDFDGGGLGVKRVLDFDIGDLNVGGGKGEDGGGAIMGEVADSGPDGSEKKRKDVEEIEKNKEKKKKVKGDGDDAKRNKRRADKERRDYLNHLHAESQRLLRETRDAAFKPVPVVQKPISSILEKIRRRKLEVSKKTVSLNGNCSISENGDSSRDVMMDHESENLHIDERETSEIVRVVNEETIVHHDNAGSSSDASNINESSESAKGPNCENTPFKAALDEEFKNAFRAPIDDTQDLFCDSQSSGSKDEQPSEQHDSPVEEAFAPSLLAMNLKLDSAPLDDTSSDEEYNDKENKDPCPGHNLSSSPKGDPVKAFVDEEAVEEDDSDNDLLRFQDNEEEDDMEDAEELNDMIATGYEEKAIDGERRKELHMKWLEQQDAAGTDNLLQRLGCGSSHGETTFLEDEEDREEDEEEFSDDAAEDLGPASIARINARKVKQMIPQMFTDKDDVFLSSDDDETEKTLVKQRLLKKAEERATFLSPVEDETSREVFGLIKKLNIVPATKQKPKAPTSFDMLSTGKSNSSSKSSFLGRVSNTSLSSSHKHGSSTARSFIFGREDSNSRSAVSMSEDSSDTIQREVHSTKTFSAKFSNLQTKSSSQNTKKVAEAVSGTSLFQILRRSSVQTNQFNEADAVYKTQSVFAAFKLPKKSVKIEGGF